MWTIIFIIIYLIGVIISINKFSAAGNDWGDGHESSYAIILSLFSWLCVAALITAKSIPKDGEEDI